jgi:hypothetical protein
MNHSEALELFGEISSEESHNRQQYLEATRFYNGSQWPDALQKARSQDPNGARPCLVINVLPHHVKQVTNEMRQNRPSIRVIPVDDGADVETAKALQGLIRHIENRSDADVVYSTAGRTAVIGGVGYWRIANEYIDEEYGYQELRLLRILNPLTVYMSRCEDPAGSDADDVFITELVSKTRFAKEYGKKKVPSSTMQIGTGDDSWLVDDYVRVAEHFHVDRKRVKAVILQDGRRVKEAWAMEQAQMGAPIVLHSDNAAPIMERSVKWSKMTGADILKEQDWPGRYIPVVRVIGQEIDIEGKRYHYGMVRDAMDPQRMRNYWRSAETEMIALAPKAPFVGAAGAFDGFEDRWRVANIQNVPYLEYNTVDVEGRPVAAPQRQPAAPMPSAIVQAAANADWDIKAATGIFGAALGEPSQEKSGKAIIARQSESDVSTFDYIDNLNNAIRHTGRILVDLAPKVYDTPRVLRILGEDGESKLMKIDPSMGQSYQESEEKEIAGIFNPSVGTYDVESVVGPSYATKREQAAESMAQILQGNPSLWAAAGDLFAKNLDWPGADELAERLKKMVPPELKDDEEEAPESNPQDLQTIQQLDQTIQAMTAELEKLQSGETQAKAAADKAQADKHRAFVDAYKAETERMKLLAERPTAIPLWMQLGLMDNQDITPDVIEAAAVPLEPMQPIAETQNPIG